VSGLGIGRREEEEGREGELSKAERKRGKEERVGERARSGLCA
jgi:hypothetical protein